MPRNNSKNLTNQIRAELGKWRGRSRVQKTSAHISYGKIKSNLHALEKLQTKEELNIIAQEIGKRQIIFIAKNSFLNYRATDGIYNKQ